MKPLIEWRGINPSLQHQLHAKRYKNTWGEDMLFFPLKVNGHYKGGVRCVYDKKPNKSPYYLTKGSKPKEVLFPYDYIKKPYKHPFVVFVEGYRDALYLIQNGFPAVANTGAVSFWDPIKANLLLDLSDNIFLMTDQDEYGYKLFNKMKLDIPRKNRYDCTGYDGKDACELSPDELVSHITTMAAYHLPLK